MGQGQIKHSTLQYEGASSPHLLSESSRLEREISDRDIGDVRKQLLLLLRLRLLRLRLLRQSLQLLLSI